MSTTIDKLAQIKKAANDPLFMADLEETMTAFANVDAEWWELAKQTGDLLTLAQIDDLISLTSRQPRVTALTERFTAEMENGNISLMELLQGLTEERNSCKQDNA